MAEKKDVVIFRRIRGKIRPIKISRRQKEALEGGALLTGGTLAGLKLGRLSGIKQRQAISRRQLAFDFGSGRAGISAQEGLMPGARSFSSSLRKVKQAKAFGTAARITSASAIGLGVEKLLTASGFEQKEFVPEFTGEAAGISTAFLVEAGSRKGAQGISLRRQAIDKFKSAEFKRSARTGLKKIARAIVGRKLKF